jgi:hypothetical protein
MEWNHTDKDSIMQTELYDILLYLIERLIPDSHEKHTLTSRVEALKEQESKPVEKKAKSHGSSEQ